MAERKPIVINNFQKGIAISSYFGFEEIRGLDITNKPGAVYPNKALTLESGTTIDDLIEGTAVDDSGVIYGYTEETYDYVFKRATNGTWTKLTGFTSSAIAGIAFWKDYIILIHLDGGLDATQDGVTWTNDFDSISNLSNKKIPTVSSVDGNLYFGSEYLVDSLVEETTFDPSDSATWSVNLGVLDLPKNYEIISMVELGDKLLIGTTNNDEDNDATIFPWKTSDDSFKLPIRLNESSIYHMIKANNMVYIQAGKKAKWYVTNGTSIQYLNKIPTTMLDLISSNTELWINSSCFSNGLIYFGVSKNDGSLGHLGVYTLDVYTNAINYAHVISTGETGENKGVRIGSLIAVRDNVIATWWDDENSSFGADDIGSARYTGDKSFLISKFERVGTRLNPYTFKEIQVYLTKPLATGDSVKIYYREAQSGSWVLVNTWSTVGDQSLYTPFLKTVKNIQFKIILNDEAELLEVIII